MFKVGDIVKFKDNPLIKMKVLSILQTVPVKVSVKFLNGVYVEYDENKYPINPSSLMYDEIYLRNKN